MLDAKECCRRSCQTAGTTNFCGKTRGDGVGSESRDVGALSAVKWGRETVGDSAVYVNFAPGIQILMV